ncbi:MAG: hypothetical protein RIC15_00665 [Vicingaceae bacterium]
MPKGHILLADSGSTKTHWVLLLNNGDRHDYFGKGINPVVQAPQEVMDSIKHQINELNTDEILSEIHFYGAGCTSQSDCELVNNALKAARSEEYDCFVYHDLMAAARSLFKGGQGVAAILGTGSSSAYYKGGVIVDRITPLGYVLGDDGGGVDLGKRLIRDIIQRKAPGHISKAFHKEFDFTDEEIVARIYQMPGPNGFIASFSKFLSFHIGESYCQELVKSAFKEFILRSVIVYGEKRIGCVGSVAYVFSTQLKEVCDEFDLELVSILKSPMDGLVDYHLKVSGV